MRTKPFSEVLALARTGDPDACGEIYARFEPDVSRRVRARLDRAIRRRNDTADVVHEVFTDAFARLATFEDRGEAAFRSWLLLRVEGEVVDAHRKARDGGGVRREVTSPDGLADARPDGAAGPATSTEAADDRSVLGELLDRLPPTDAAVLRLRASESLPYDEVARRLGLASADAARMRYARAIVELRRLWGTRR